LRPPSGSTIEALKPSLQCGILFANAESQVSLSHFAAEPEAAIVAATGWAYGLANIAPKKPASLVDAESPSEEEAWLT